MSILRSTNVTDGAPVELGDPVEDDEVPLVGPIAVDVAGSPELPPRVGPVGNTGLELLLRG